MANNIKLLDCTFRDGGYYNNWNFDKKIIPKYLNDINKIGINYVELGFRNPDKTNLMGENAYTTDTYLNKFKIPKDIQVVVMVNASDLFINKKDPLYNCKKLFPNPNRSKVRFVRLACHLHEIFLLKKVIKWLKKNNFMIFINLMQISEIKDSNIKKVCLFLNKTNADILYLADSLGSLTPKKISYLVNLVKKYYKFEIGFHAHNNLKLALKNAIAANNSGAKWIDSTIKGMGRGPGNLLTEDIIGHLNYNSKKKFFSKQLKDYFNILKKKYNWGPNQYYKIAAKNKIHPTYIQKMLSDERYKKLNYLDIIKSLKKTETSKYNPIRYFQYAFFSKKKQLRKNFLIKNITNKTLIIGSGKSVRKNKFKIEKFIRQNNVNVIALNTTSSINEKLIDYRVACHPLRIISDISIYKKNQTKLIIPYSSFNSGIKNLIKKYKIKFLDYGLKLSMNNKIHVKNNYCVLPDPLAIGYALSIFSAKSKNDLYFAGIDGFDISNSETDNTIVMIKYFFSKIIKNRPISLTQSKYKKMFKFLSL